MQYSVREIIGKSGTNYGMGVYLDTNIFSGVKPRNWNKILSNFVYKNLANKNIEVFNSDGTSEIISFAKTNERIKKDNAKNSHRVIDKLARTTGNINSLAIIHIDELLNTNEFIGETKENTHQWLDKNGWMLRKTYLMDKKGQIYETILNIAKSKDGRNVLYSLSNTKKVDDGDVFSASNEDLASNEEELAHNDQPFDGSISHYNKQYNDEKVNNHMQNYEQDSVII